MRVWLVKIFFPYFEALHWYHNLSHEKLRLEGTMAFDTKTENTKY